MRERRPGGKGGRGGRGGDTRGLGAGSILNLRMETSFAEEETFEAGGDASKLRGKCKNAETQKVGTPIALVSVLGRAIIVE